MWNSRKEDFEEMQNWWDFVGLNTDTDPGVFFHFSALRNNAFRQYTRIEIQPRRSPVHAILWIKDVPGETFFVSLTEV